MDHINLEPLLSKNRPISNKNNKINMSITTSSGKEIIFSLVDHKGWRVANGFCALFLRFFISSIISSYRLSITALSRSKNCLPCINCSSSPVHVGPPPTPLGHIYKNIKCYSSRVSKNLFNWNLRQKFRFHFSVFICF